MRITTTILLIFGTIYLQAQFVPGFQFFGSNYQFDEINRPNERQNNLSSNGIGFGAILHYKANHHRFGSGINIHVLQSPERDADEDMNETMQIIEIPMTYVSHVHRRVSLEFSLVHSLYIFHGLRLGSHDLDPVSPYRMGLKLALNYRVINHLNLQLFHQKNGAIGGQEKTHWSHSSFGIGINYLWMENQSKE